MKFDIAHHLGAVTREVAARDHEGKPARVVLVSRSYDTSIDDLWDALTSVERIPRWFLPITGELRLGGRYQLQGNAGGTVTACEPPRSFAATWECFGQMSWITVQLSEADGGARLELEHIAHVGGDLWDQFGPGAVGVGWESGLLGLAAHLATGQANDPAAAAVWTASDEGKAFMTGSSEGWRLAAIAAGADEETATAAAARTTAAYTGQG